MPDVPCGVLFAFHIAAQATEKATKAAAEAYSGPAKHPVTPTLVRSACRVPGALLGRASPIQSV